MSQFCISKENLNKLFYTELAETRLDLILEKFSDKYSPQEIFEQTESEQGEVGEFCKKQNDKFSEKTENVEIAHSIDLAQFYFPDENPEICFNLKNGSHKINIKTVEDLIKNIGPDTEIDCLIKNESRQFKFQLKEYPEKYLLGMTAQKVIEFLDKNILPPEKYNNKNNKDLIIIITLKPEINTEFKESSDFKIIHEYLKDKKIELTEIDFMYNRNCEYIVWYQVYPQLGHAKIPWVELPYQKVKRLEI